MKPLRNKVGLIDYKVYNEIILKKYLTYDNWGMTDMRIHQFISASLREFALSLKK
jgi:hypothetical protein